MTVLARSFVRSLARARLLGRRSTLDARVETPSKVIPVDFKNIFFFNMRNNIGLAVLVQLDFAVFSSANRNGPSNRQAACSQESFVPVPVKKHMVVLPAVCLLRVLSSSVFSISL